MALMVPLVPKGQLERQGRRDFKAILAHRVTLVHRAILELMVTTGLKALKVTLVHRAIRGLLAPTGSSWPQRRPSRLQVQHSLG